MERVVLYSTGCPKCRVLKKKLDECGIPYSENNSVDDMLSIGIMEAPKLLVNGELLDFSSAVKWTKDWNGINAD